MPRSRARPSIRSTSPAENSFAHSPENWCVPSPMTDTCKPVLPRARYFTGVHPPVLSSAGRRTNDGPGKGIRFFAAGKNYGFELVGGQFPGLEGFHHVPDAERQRPVAFESGKDLSDFCERHLVGPRVNALLDLPVPDQAFLVQFRVLCKEFQFTTGQLSLDGPGDVNDLEIVLLIAHVQHQKLPLVVIRVNGKLMDWQMSRTCTLGRDGVPSEFKMILPVVNAMPVSMLVTRLNGIRGDEPKPWQTLTQSVKSFRRTTPTNPVRFAVCCEYGVCGVAGEVSSSNSPWPMP